jgi:glutathione S-transferase
MHEPPDTEVGVELHAQMQRLDATFQRRCLDGPRPSQLDLAVAALEVLAQVVDQLGVVEEYPHRPLLPVEPQLTMR